MKLELSFALGDLLTARNRRGARATLHKSRASLFWLAQIFLGMLRPLSQSDGLHLPIFQPYNDLLCIRSNREQPVASDGGQ